MDHEAQRKFIADAAERGITMAELMKEFQQNDGLNQAVYAELYPRPPARIDDVPSSECPVMSAVMIGMGRLCNYEGQSLSGEMGRFLSDPRAAAASTLEQQYERATLCARWFRANVLTLTESDALPVPAGDIAKACKPLLEALTEEHGPVGLATAAFESALAILNSYGTECARQNKSARTSAVRIQMRHTLSDLWRKMFPWVPPEELAAVPAPGSHVHPDGDLDRALTIAEAAAGVGASPVEGLPELTPEFLAQLDAAEREAGVFPPVDLGAPHADTFIEAGDVSPGGVLKK